ncbi:hypothetical protein EJB05_45094, partial [Eragrostis curvula]
PDLLSLPRIQPASSLSPPSRIASPSRRIDLAAAFSPFAACRRLLSSSAACRCLACLPDGSRPRRPRRPLTVRSSTTTPLLSDPTSAALNAGARMRRGAGRGRRRQGPSRRSQEAGPVAALKVCNKASMDAIHFR